MVQLFAKKKIISPEILSLPEGSTDIYYKLATSFELLDYERKQRNVKSQAYIR